MSEIPILDHDQVLDAVDPAEAIARVHDAFLAHQRGDWVMPAKVYLDCEPYGDFRAMPARGGGLALLKWVTSFPGNPAHGLPTVTGIVCLSDARDGRTLMVLDARAVTALRTGAVAAVAARALAREDARTVGIVGCGPNGASAARCLAAAGYGPGVCADLDQSAAGALAAELGWEVGEPSAALGCDVVTCVTPGHTPVINVGDLRAGAHLNMLGADAAGKAEATVEAVLRCEVFCDEWQQASHGGELAGAVASGALARAGVGELGGVLAGEQGGRSGRDVTTLFDSTGLAIQDLAIAAAVLERWRAGEVTAPTVTL